MEVDLSKELSAPVKPAIAKQVEKAQTSENRSQKWRPAPTRRKQERWDRAYKVATGGSLKNKLQILTLGIGGVGLLSAYVSYTPEIAASYGVGLLGSLPTCVCLVIAWILWQMEPGGWSRAIGQPRLLVPVVLVVIYNRWNGILFPEYGVMHLELIPMLVGFFTYKIATFTQAIEEALTIVGRKSEV